LSNKLYRKLEKEGEREAFENRKKAERPKC